MKIATDIRTTDWDRIIKGLIGEGWSISLEYNEFDARIDFNFIELRKGQEVILCGWDNWVEGEIKASGERIKYIEKRFKIDFSFGKPVNLQPKIIQLTKAQVLFKKLFEADVNEEMPKVKVVSQENEFDSVLLKLYNSEGEKILGEKIINESPISGRDFQKLLEILIEVDLIEYDKTDKAYYLTSEGYQRVEDIQHQLDHNAEKTRPKKQPNYFLVFLILILLVGTYNAIFGIKPSPASNDVLNEEVIDIIHSDIKERVDSLVRSGGTIEYENK